MKKYLTIGSAIMLRGTAWGATAETIMIGVSDSDGEYVKAIVPTISEALQEYDYVAIVEPSTNSQENIDKVRNGEILAALVQLDVAALNMTEDKDPSETLSLLGGKILSVPLFCAAYKGGNVVTYHDLTDKQEVPLKISVGNKNAVTARTFQYLMTLDPELKDIEFFHEEDTMMELNRLLSGRRNLVCFVTMPDPEHELIKMVTGHNELFFITIDKLSFAEAKVNDILIYDIIEVPVTEGFFGFNPEKVKTLITWIGFVVNEKQIDKTLSKQLTQIIRNPDLWSNSLTTKAKRLFETVVNRIGEVVD